MAEITYEKCTSTASQVERLLGPHCFILVSNNIE
jgi:hypothetical protein